MKQFKLLKAADASSVILLNTIFQGWKRIVNSDEINDYFIFNRNLKRCLHSDRHQNFILYCPWTKFPITIIAKCTIKPLFKVLAFQMDYPNELHDSDT